jgi:hypothetical protein
MNSQRLLQIIPWLLPFACWAQAQQTNPAWFNQPQIFAVDDGCESPSQSPLSSIPYTGQIFGDYIMLTSTPDSELEQAVSSWHAKGGFSFYLGDLYARNDGSTPADWDAFRMRTLSGAYLNLGGFYAPENTPLYSLSSPVFRQAILAAAMHAVDLGADGMTFDDAQGQIDIMFVPSDQAGSFDSVTMAAFQAYLQQNFTASQLMSQFGISDIGSFNYASSQLSG